MPDLNYIRAEIEHVRRQIVRHRKEIQDLQRAGIATKSADELLIRMQTKVDGLCEERDRLVGEQRRKYPGTNKVINGPIERRFGEHLSADTSGRSANAPLLGGAA
jgi:hypothetical protein